MLSRHAPGRVFGDYIDREFGCAGNLGDHRNRCDCGSSDRNCSGSGRPCGMGHEILSRQRAAAHQDARDGACGYGRWLPQPEREVREAIAAFTKIKNLTYLPMA